MAVQIEPVHLQAIQGTAVFYPCCGQDLETPVRLFASAATAFYFVDVRRPGRLRSVDSHLVSLPRGSSLGHDKYRHLASGNEFDLFRVEGRGEDAFMKVQRLGVFFHRGDTLANGEGSSGVPWLGKEWLAKILAKLVPGGLLVTDGSNRPVDGPPELSAFHTHRTVGATAVAETRPFKFGSRHLSCVGYAGDRYGPTLVWQAA